MDVDGLIDSVLTSWQLLTDESLTAMSSPTGRIADPSDIVLGSDGLESPLFQLQQMGRRHSALETPKWAYPQEARLIPWSRKRRYKDDDIKTPAKRNRFGTGDFNDSGYGEGRGDESGARASLSQSVVSLSRHMKEAELHITNYATETYAFLSCCSWRSISGLHPGETFDASLINTIVSLHGHAAGHLYLGTDIDAEIKSKGFGYSKKLVENFPKKGRWILQAHDEHWFGGRIDWDEKVIGIYNPYNYQHSLGRKEEVIAKRYTEWVGHLSPDNSVPWVSISLTGPRLYAEDQDLSSILVTQFACYQMEGREPWDEGRDDIMYKTEFIKLFDNMREASPGVNMSPTLQPTPAKSIGLEEDLDYWRNSHPDFDPSSLTIQSLRECLKKHGHKPLSSLRKSGLVQMFKDQIVPAAKLKVKSSQKRKLQAGKRRTKELRLRSSRY